MKLDKIVKNLINFLYKNQVDGSFEARTYYGELYAALAMAIYNKDFFLPTILQFIDSYYYLDKNHDSFHWEFNNYALIELQKEMPKRNKKIDVLLKKPKFKGTKVTNWTLLRNLTLFKLKIKQNEAKKNAKTRILRMQRNGLIKDDEDVRSLQYHCFSMSLIGEFFLTSGDVFFKDRFFSAVEFISKFILPNGMTNYIGRGQEQIFGYGPLIFSLLLAYKIKKDNNYLEKTGLILKHINSFQRSDGSFPLVLRKEEKGIPLSNVTNNKNYLGWYNYNNYFDYLAFFAYYLVKVLKLEMSEQIAGIPSSSRTNETNFVNNDFLVVKKKKYTAVLSRPGGYWTNDLPIPLICNSKGIFSPIYGGEQFGSHLYNESMIPLPWGIVNWKNACFLISNKSLIKTLLRRKSCFYLRNHLNYDLTSNSISGSSRVLTHNRLFKFYHQKIEIFDVLKFKKKCYFHKFYFVNLLFYNLSKKDNETFISNIYERQLTIEIYYDYPLTLINHYGFSALGSLDAIKDNFTNTYFGKNDILKAKYILRVNS